MPEQLPRLEWEDELYGTSFFLVFPHDRINIGYRSQCSAGAPDEIGALKAGMRQINRALGHPEVAA